MWRTILSAQSAFWKATASIGVVASLLGAMPALAQDAVPSGTSEVTAERLLNTDKEPQNWLTYHGNYAGHRFSALNEINRDNVKNLHVAFTFPLGGMGGGGPYSHAALEGTPLVNDGFMYLTNGWGEVFKVDVREGYAKPVWKVDPQVDKEWAAGVTCCDIDNRGAALWKNKVVSHTLDGRILLIDDATGEVDWEQRLADPDKGETITAAPLVIKDMAITGMSGAEKAVRGWLVATDLASGEELWRTYMVPEPGEPGSETWKDDHNAWKYGGGATWGNGTYDPATNKIYWGTANPGPDFDPEYRPGDNLYTDSMVVLDADTGKIDWHFQYTPNDPHDHDEISEHPLIDVAIDGTTHKFVVHSGRNGLFYRFDRDAKSFVSGVPYLDKVTWTKGLDPETGLPVEYDSNKDIQTYVAETTGLRDKPPTEDLCPTTMGGKNWQPSAYNPELHLLYIPAIESCGLLGAKEQEKPKAEGGTWELPDSFTGIGLSKVSHISGSIVAMDVTTGEIAKKIPTDYANWGGVLTTAGNLLFASTVDGWVKAYDAATLEELWKFNVGSGINAPPMTYSVGGKQYVAIEIGSLQSAPWRGIADAQAGLEPTSTLYVFSL